MIHSGAVIGGLVSRNYARMRNARYKDQPLNGQNERRDFVAAGATAGVSAAFGAPMGACLFAIEEGTSHMSPRILMKLFAAAGWACLVCRISFNLSASKFGDGARGVLGSEVPVFFQRFDSGMTYAHWELPIFGLIGVCGGLIGGIFNRCNKELTKVRKKFMAPPKLKDSGPFRGMVDVRKSDVVRFCEVLFVTFVISSIQFWLPIFAHGLQPTTKEELNPTQQLFWCSGTNALRRLLHQEEAFDVGFLIVFFVVQITTTCWTYGLGVPSGLFVPSLLAGAAFGRLCGQFMQHHFGVAGPGIYALVGATALLGGAARITISLAMILMEATGESAFSLPIFLVVLIARWIGNYFGRGIYDMHIIDLKRIPLLETDPEDCMIDMKAHEVMSTEIVSVKEVELVGELHDMLTSNAHSSFPVLRDGHIVGLIPRDVLHFLLNNCEQYGALEEEERRIIPYGKFCRQTAMMAPGLKPLRKFQRVVNKHLDLTPYMTRCFHTMASGSTVYVCYQLFRSLGLRHLFVQDERGKVVGVITRKDLILIEDEDGHDVMTASSTKKKSSYERAASEPSLGNTFGGMGELG